MKNILLALFCFPLLLGAQGNQNLTVGWPIIHASQTSLMGPTGFTLDASTDSEVMIMQMPVVDALLSCGFNYGVRTGTPPTYRISLQGVSAAGIEDGTIKSSTNAFATFTPPASTAWDTTWQEFTLTASYTTTRGEFLAIVVDYSSGTISGANNSSINRVMANTGPVGLPYLIDNNAGSRSRNSVWALFGCSSSTKMYGVPAGLVTMTQFSSNSSPNEYALAFSIPCDLFASYNVLGFNALLRLAAAGKVIHFSIYSGTSVVQGPLIWDSDVGQANGNNGSEAYLLFTDTNLTGLTCGTTYRLSVIPQDLTNNIALGRFSATGTNAMTAFPFGTSWYLSTRAGGAWTDTTTSRPLVELIIADSGFVAGGPKGGSFAFAN